MRADSNSMEIWIHLQRGEFFAEDFKHFDFRRESVEDGQISLNDARLENNRLNMISNFTGRKIEGKAKGHHVHRKYFVDNHWRFVEADSSRKNFDVDGHGGFLEQIMLGSRQSKQITQK